MADLAARLEPFLLLARSTKGAAAAKVITDATAAPGVYVFAELLELPNIRELETNPDFAKHFNLLRLFAYGTLKVYSEIEAYPPLTAAHVLKLKHLTLVSLALQQRSISYDLLLAQLQLESVRQLEDLIIDVIYAGLLGGKMHHHENMLHIDWVAGRDLTPEGLETVRTGLGNWCKTAQTLLSALDQQIQQVRYQGHVSTQSLHEYNTQRDALFEKHARSAKQPSRGGTLPTHDLRDEGNPLGLGPRSGRAGGGGGAGMMSDDADDGDEVEELPWGAGPGSSGRSGAGGGGERTRIGVSASFGADGGVLAEIGAGSPGRNLTRGAGQPDELEGARESKRQRD